MQNPIIASNTRSPSGNDFLVNAGKAVEKIIASEETYHDLADSLAGATSDSYIKPLLSSSEEFEEVNSVPIPQPILAEMEGVQARCFMGTFPEIGRAWLTIDHRLFIWSYTNTREIFEYGDQDQIITSVAIIKPKPNIFSDNINYLLAFATPLQVVLLGLSVTPTELKVFSTEMTASADDVIMRKIMGTEDGRIFMNGNDGNVYEFVYRHPAVLIGNNCYIECKTLSLYEKYLPRFIAGNNNANVKLLAVDNERRILYLMSNSSIEAIYLGDGTNEYRFIAKNSTIVETAIQMCRQHSRFYAQDAFELESLHIISEAESKRIHLMAITSAGFRLYFSLFRDGFRNTIMNTGTSTNTFNALEFGHIRIPPPNESQPHTNALVRGTYYDCGVCLSIKTKNDDIDTIVVTAAAPSHPPTPQQSTSRLFYNPTQIPSRPTYVESTETVDTKAKALSLSETRAEFRGKRVMKELSQQISVPPRQFIALTTQHITFYNKLRPVDILLRILTKQNRVFADEQKEIQAFFTRYGQTEACAMCLSIVCNAVDSDIKTKATKVFFDFGGLPTAANSLQAPGNHLGQVVGQTGINYSGKHDGFLLCFGRMVAPIWKLKVFANCNPQNPNSSILYVKAQNLLFDARSNLDKLKAFMDENRGFHDNANITDPRFQVTDRTRLELDLAEQKSVRDLYMLLSQCTNVVYFIEFLLNSNLQSLLVNNVLPDEYYQSLLDLDIDTMLTTVEGRELARELVISCIGKYGATNSHTSFDVVSSQLQQWGSAYFTENDILFFKGMEHIRRAIGAESDYERRVSIQESLSYFKQAAAIISCRKMEAISSIYLQFSFHIGLVELALERAQKVDPQNLALLAFQAPQDSDEVKNGFLQAREESYDFALKAVDDAYLLKSRHIPIDFTPVADPNVHFRLLVDAAFRSTDMLFHFKLYHWFMQKGLRDELMKTNTPYLVTYFKNYISDEKKSLDFLWEYYRNNNDYAKAAECLHLLAFSTSNSISLTDRVNYLSMTVINITAASLTQSVSARQIEIFTTEVEQELKAAMLQSSVRDILKGHPDVDAQVAADNLDKCLLTEQELYEQYGSQFQILAPVFANHMI